MFDVNSLPETILHANVLGAQAPAADRIDIEFRQWRDSLIRKLARERGHHLECYRRSIETLRLRSRVNAEAVRIDAAGWFHEKNFHYADLELTEFVSLSEAEQMALFHRSLSARSVSSNQRHSAACSLLASIQGGLQAE